MDSLQKETLAAVMSCGGISRITTISLLESWLGPLAGVAKDVLKWARLQKRSSFEVMIDSRKPHGEAGRKRSDALTHAVAMAGWSRCRIELFLRFDDGIEPVSVLGEGMLYSSGLWMIVRRAPAAGYIRCYN